MKKVLLVLLVLVCFFMGMPFATAEILKTNGAGIEEGYDLFMAAHPEVEVIRDGTRYMNPNKMSTALLTGELDSDVFELNNIYFDPHLIMEKGFCLDLSESEIIRNGLEKMWPSVRKQLMIDNQIYAIPTFMVFQYFCIVPEGWEAAGFSTNEIPQNYPDLLDFLEKWVDCMADDSQNIGIMNMWDPVIYNEYSYTQWLVEAFFENHVMQCEFAQVPIRFNQPEIVTLLERTLDVGIDLYDIDPAYRASLSLIEQVSSAIWKEDLQTYMISMRSNDNQPRLLATLLGTNAANAATEHKALAIELLEQQITHISDEVQVYFYQEAQPVKNPTYELEIAKTQKNIANTQEKLKDPTLDVYEKEDLEIVLKNYEEVLKYEIDAKYHFSPEKLEDYKSFANNLYFPTPSVFRHSSTERNKMRTLSDHLAQGAITPQPFVEELDRMAQMIEMEEVP